MGEKRILIVEDDADISMIEEAYLNTAGLETKIGRLEGLQGRERNSLSQQRI